MRIAGNSSKTTHWQKQSDLFAQQFFSWISPMGDSAMDLYNKTYYKYSYISFILITNCLKNDLFKHIFAKIVITVCKFHPSVTLSIACALLKSHHWAHNLSCFLSIAAPACMRSIIPIWCDAFLICHTPWCAILVPAYIHCCVLPN